MSKFVKLLTSAMVGGVSRTPAEGVLHLSDDEADRLIADDAAEDVTSDFTAAQRKSTPVMLLTADTPTPPDHVPAPHLSEVTPDAAETGVAAPATAAAKSGE